MSISNVFKKAKLAAASVIPAAALTTLPTHEADAAIIVQGTGEINFVDSDLAGAGIDLNDAFTFEITIDDTVADIATINTTLGYFPDSILNFDFVIDGTALNFTGGDISVRNLSSDSVAFNSLAADQTTAVPDINGLSFKRVNMMFDNSNILSDDSLAGGLVNLPNFADADFYFDYGNNIIRGDITSVNTSAIPEPSHVVLLAGAGALGAAALRRRRKANTAEAAADKDSNLDSPSNDLT